MKEDTKAKISRIMSLENMTSVQFAGEIGIQSSTLSHILNGRNKPSLDVLVKILNRFRTISSDWLILDSGVMYRQEKNSQTPSLFPNEDESVSISDTYDKKTPQNSIQAINDKKVESNKIVTIEPDEVKSQITEIKNEGEIKKTVNKIIIYFSDNTFQEFYGK